MDDTGGGVLIDDAGLDRHRAVLRSVAAAAARGGGVVAASDEVERWLRHMRWGHAPLRGVGGGCVAPRRQALPDAAGAVAAVAAREAGAARVAEEAAWLERAMAAQRGGDAGAPSPLARGRLIATALPGSAVACADDDACSGDVCSVCLDSYTAGQMVRRLRCAHTFHADCIEPWLEAHTTCPCCRGEVMVPILSLRGWQPGAPRLAD
jgi:hypothetical protein